VKALLVEDDRKTAMYLRKGLSESGFAVDVAERGDDGLHLALAGHYDIVVLDIMLPERDGWSVLAEIRRSGNQTPIVILTARDAVSDRVKGLEQGADDYLVKPFAFSELLARMRTVLRRGTKLQPAALRVADLEIDFVQHRAVRGGRKLDLTRKEFALLSLLVRRRGEALTRTVIADQVWDLNFDSHTNVVDVHMRRLRLKVDEGFEHKLIQTVRGVGYVLEGPAGEESGS
jgi:two-component system, OmpR family, copper resistance phosphate regulon response regulator CusR